MYDEKEIEPRILELVKGAEQPVSVGWVATNLGVSWATARIFLTSLENSNQLKTIKTTRATLFAL